MSDSKDEDTTKALPAPQPQPEPAPAALPVAAAPPVALPVAAPVASPVALSGPPPDPWDFMHPDELRDLWRAMVRGGTEGDWHSAEVARRMWRLRQHRIRVDLPPIDDAAGIARAQVQLIIETASGLRDPQDAHHLSRMIENRRRALETHELEKGLHELNEINAEAQRKGGGRR